MDFFFLPYWCAYLWTFQYTATDHPDCEKYKEKEGGVEEVNESRLFACIAVEYLFLIMYIVNTKLLLQPQIGEGEKKSLLRHHITG